MTYQVLARKWRPRSFETLIGQEHVVRALTHALDSQRLHHAWLFTGTRGVGKTTLSRLLAKALNCEQGVSATPCGVCRACVEIDQGRFVDYVELDAASNRGVDEMTQLLEQAVYAPSAARYKVYMIDEVHMLTGHAFNAMLKTLEEPPAHVKFILATTDPQKIPPTVLSRCLQFNLKQMTVPAIEAHLQDVLVQEQISTEGPALRLLAQAAAGSMRDALSLTDQAIAYSAGAITTDAVQGMLGTIDQSHLIRLLQALIEGNGAQLVAIADEMALRGLSFSRALADLAVLLSRLAIEQRVPGALPADEPNAAAIQALAQQLSPDHVQLFYSVVVHSREELALAPDEYAGFMMACLRLYALMPAGSLPMAEAVVPAPAPAPAPALAPARVGIQPPMVERGGQAQAPAPTPAPVPTPAPTPTDDIPPWLLEDSGPPPDFTAGELDASASEAVNAPPAHAVATTPQELSASQWAELAPTLALSGWAAELAQQAEWVSCVNNQVVLRVAIRSADDSQAKPRINTVLNEHFGQALHLHIEYGSTGDETAFSIAQADLAERQLKAEADAQQNPFILALMQQFDAQIVPDSVRVK